MSGAVTSSPCSGPAAPAAIGTPSRPASAATRRAFSVARSSEQFPATVVTASRSIASLPAASSIATASSWPGSQSSRIGVAIAAEPYGRGAEASSRRHPRGPHRAGDAVRAGHPPRASVPCRTRCDGSPPWSSAACCRSPSRWSPAPRCRPRPRLRRRPPRPRPRPGRCRSSSSAFTGSATTRSSCAATGCGSAAPSRRSSRGSGSPSASTGAAPSSPRSRCW